MLLLALLVLAHRSASARPTLAGTWSAGPLDERWNIGEWRDACGPRPAARTLPGGEAVVRERGGELAIEGAGAYNTSDCGETWPGFARASHTVSSLSWSNHCASPPSDPRQASVVTTLSATETTLDFDETGQYQVHVQGGTCTASVRRSRHYVLVRREGEVRSIASLPTTGPAGPPSSTAAGPTPAMSAPSAGACADPGAPARIEVRPGRKLLMPGQRFAFRAAVTDAQGCSIDARPVWSVVTASPGIRVSSAGLVTVAEDAPDGRSEVLASIGSKGAHVFVEVASRTRYEGLLEAEVDAAAAEEVAVGSLQTEAVGSLAAAGRDGSHKRRLAFVAVVGSLACILAGLGLVMLRRQRRGALEPARIRSAAPPLLAGGILAVGGIPASRARLTCPSCLREFPPDSAFCAFDGRPLVEPTARASDAAPPGGVQCPTCGRRYGVEIAVCPVDGTTMSWRPPADAARNSAAGAGRRGKICPSCGGMYSGDASFCGKDGTALVLVN